MEFAFFMTVGIAFIAFVLFGGKTYYLTLESFLNQIPVYNESEIHIQDMQKFKLVGSNKNGVGSIICLDKKGDKYRFKVNSGTQIRFTKNNGKKQMMFLNSLYIINSEIYGSKSQLVTLPIRPININEIAKIELQFKNSKKEELF